MDKNIKVVYNKLDNIKVNNEGYVDLSNSSIKKKKDLVNVCNIFRDARYETFRIFYMKNDKIVGQEAITSRIPNAVIVFPKEKNSGSNPAKAYEKMNNRMKRLGADGYYLAHNHSSESAKPSQQDMEITRNFVANVEGFLGHIVLGNSDRYSIIEENSRGLILMPKEKSLNKNTLTDMQEKMKENTLYDIKISSREDLVALLKQIQNEKEYSTAILTNGKGNIRMILDIPNKMFNQDEKNLNGFFKNLARNSGSTRVFIGTQNRETYNKVLEHQKYGTIKDLIYIDNKNNLIRGADIKESPDLFDKETRRKLKRDREAR